MNEQFEALVASLSTATSSIEKVDILNKLSWDARDGDRDQAIIWGQEAYELAKTADEGQPYYLGQAHALRALSWHASQSARYGDALTYALEGVAILEKIDQEKHLLTDILSTVGVTYRRLGDLPSALEYQLKQLHLSEELGDMSTYGRSLTGLGISYHDMGQHDRALEYFERSLAAQREVDNTYGIAMALNNISYFHVSQGNYEAALEHGLASIAVSREHGHERMELSASNTLGEAYLHLEQPDNALLHLNNALTLARAAGRRGHEADALKLIGRTHLLQQNHQEAISHLEQSLAIAQEINHKRYTFQAHLYLTEAYKLAGDFATALTHHEAFHALKEDVYNDQNSQKLQNLEVLYRTESAQQEAAHYATQYATEQSRRRLTETLHQVGQVLTGTLDLEDVLAQVLAQLAQLITFDRGALLLWQQEKLIFVATRGYNHDDDPLGHHLPIDFDNEWDVFGRIYRQKQPLTIDNVSQYPQWRTINDVPLPGAWLGVPLVHQGAVMGMLSLARDQSDAYEQEAVTVATMFAAQVAITLANAHLYAQAQRQAREMTTLTQVGEDVLASLDLSTVLERIAYHAHTLFQAAHTILWLREHDDAPQLHAIVALGPYAQQFRQDTVSVGHGIAGQVAATGVAEIVHDTEEDQRGAHVAGTPKEEPLSMMMAPIRARTAIIGVISLYRDQDNGRFEQGDLEFLLGLGRQAAIAIDNARLYAQIRQFNEQLEAEVAARTADLQEAYGQLARLDKTKTDFIGVTAHELRTPITILQGYSQLLESDKTIRANDYHLNLVSGIVSGAKRMHKIVNNMLMMIKIDSRSLEMHPEPLPLHRLFTTLHEELTDSLHERILTLTLDDTLSTLPEINGDPEALLMVGRQLLMNAIKYTPDGGQITITGQSIDAHPRLDGKSAVQIAIQDTGIGIPPDSLDLIFTKFYQTGEVSNHSSGTIKFKGGGPGLGLAMARGIIEAHGGKLWAESPGYDEETLPGSTFYLLLETAH
ncbi:MAG TPA: GAF domain-containing protein [Anaerolineae bacterium]|nr:GAF domain-containing protein [Anaerolineae bacterium]